MAFTFAFAFTTVCFTVGLQLHRISVRFYEMGVIWAISTPSYVLQYE